MKKLINLPDEVLADALVGVAAAHPSLTVNMSDRYIARAGGPTPGKVGLLSGGGAGHEPLHGGFVGYGMLDAACPGVVFTSPVPDQILAATRAVDGGAGVLHIVKNYTGDVLNFQMAADLAADDGVRVEGIVVNDDVAVENSADRQAHQAEGGAGGRQPLLVEPAHRVAGTAAPPRTTGWSEAPDSGRRPPRPAAPATRRSPARSRSAARCAD